MTTQTRDRILRITALGALIALAFTVGRIRVPSPAEQAPLIRPEPPDEIPPSRSGRVAHRAEPVPRDEYPPTNRLETARAAPEAATPITRRTIRGTLRNNDRVARAIALAELLKTADGPLLQQSVQTLSNLPPGYHRKAELSLLMHRWGQLDAAGALSYLSTWSGSEAEKRHLINRALTGWAEQDPDAALAWAGALDEEADRYTAISSVLTGLAGSDPYRAAEKMSELPDRYARGRVSQAVITGLLQQGVSSLTAWVDRTDNEDQKKYLVEQVAARLGAEAPQAGESWILQLDPELMPMAVGQYVNHWIRSEPELASDWAQRLTDDDARRTGLNRSVGNWARRDPAAAAEWLSRQPPSPELDYPIRQLAERIRYENPETALSWAMQITDEKRRHSTTQRILKDWARRNPEEADRFLTAP